MTVAKWQGEQVKNLKSWRQARVGIKESINNSMTGQEEHQSAPRTKIDYIF